MEPAAGVGPSGVNPARRPIFWLCKVLIISILGYLKNENPFLRFVVIILPIFSFINSSFFSGVILLLDHSLFRVCPADFIALILSVCLLIGINIQKTSRREVCIILKVYVGFLRSLQLVILFSSENVHFSF
jgi:hypothetical protein